MSGRDPAGTTLGVLWAAGHIAAATLLGVTVHDHLTGSPSTTAARPDTPMTEPDQPPAAGA